MQDPNTFQPMKTLHGFPEQEQLKCPRCDSTNTKFCYYNNYNLSQPRHFCKNCRRYWTKGGTLRNIPVGGGSRKNTKRSSSNTTKRSSAPSSSLSSSPSPSVPPAISEPDPSRMYGGAAPISGGFSSLLEGLNSNGGSDFKPAAEIGGASSVQRVVVDSPSSGSEIQLQNNNNSDSERFLGIMQNGDTTNFWNGENGWSNLAMYTPGSSFQ